jgi:hypothetical protein
MAEHPNVPFITSVSGWHRVPWDRICKVEIGADGAHFFEIGNTRLEEVLMTDGDIVEDLVRAVPASPAWLSIPDQLDPGHLQFVRFDTVEDVAFVPVIESGEKIVLSVLRHNTIVLAESFETQVKDHVRGLLRPGQD